MNAIQQLAHLQNERARINAEMRTLERRLAEELNKPRDTSHTIATAVATDQGVPVDFITSRSRADHYVRARAIAYTIARTQGWSLPRIGAWARRDHATIHHALNAHANNPDVLEAVRRITEAMNEQAAA